MAGYVEPTPGAVPAFDRWGELSGQMQGWQMFSNGWMRQAAYPSAELHFADGRVVVRRSRFEPDAVAPVRPPAAHSRYLHSETDLVGLDFVLTPDALAADPEGGRAAALDAVRANPGLYAAYLRAASRAHRAENPGDPEPTAVVMVVRRYQTPDPRHAGTGRTFSTRTVSRWRPGAETVEACDPVSGAFVPLTSERP